LVDPQRRIQDAAIRCDELLQRLQVDIARLLEQRRMRIAPHEARLRGGVRNLLLRKRERLARNMAVLDSLSPLKVLERGYSMVLVGRVDGVSGGIGGDVGGGVGGKVATDAAAMKVGQDLHIRMGKGSLDARVTKIYT
jgi:exonuclease VII large subunit